MNEHRGKLVLADGRVFPGILGGARQPVAGEVCFVTHMTGYLELMTDPCMEGQLLCFTYPTIGNYGVFPAHSTSAKVHARGMIVREACPWPSHFADEMTLQTYLEQQDTTLIEELDTRALVRHLREHGAQRGAIVPFDMPHVEAIALAERTPETHTEPDDSLQRFPGRQQRLAVLNCGAADRLLDDLQKVDCDLSLYPLRASAEEILAAEPQGLLISDGSEHLKATPERLALIRHLAEQLPVFAVGRGHQLLAAAFGAEIVPMPQGHRGSNHPVCSELSPRIPMTRQNHGLAVARQGLEETGFAVSHYELHDKSVEGLRHRELPLWSLQFYPDCSETTIDRVAEMQGFWQRLNERAEEKGAK